MLGDAPGVVAQAAAAAPRGRPEESGVRGQGSKARGVGGCGCLGAAAAAAAAATAREGLAGEGLVRALLQAEPVGEGGRG
jgi:hypothetical protein